MESKNVIILIELKSVAIGLVIVAIGQNANAAAVGGNVRVAIGWNASVGIGREQKFTRIIIERVQILHISIMSQMMALKKLVIL